MIRIWKEGGTMERAGVILQGVALVSCFFDIVDFTALPKAFDRLVVALPLTVLAWVLVFGGQRLRHLRQLAQPLPSPPATTPNDGASSGKDSGND